MKGYGMDKEMGWRRWRIEIRKTTKGYSTYLMALPPKELAEIGWMPQKTPLRVAEGMKTCLRWNGSELVIHLLLPRVIHRASRSNKAATRRAEMKAVTLGKIAGHESEAETEERTTKHEI